jgi:ribosome-associated protein
VARVNDIRVTAGAREVVIPAETLAWQFVRSSGPGGQHVNRTSSKAVLRFDVRNSPHLPDDVRQRFLVRERSRLTSEGAIVIVSQRHRDQPGNVADCIAKLTELVRRAVVPPKVRRKTKKPRSAVTSRLTSKKRRSERKQLRRSPPE